MRRKNPLVLAPPPARRLAEAESEPESFVCPFHIKRIPRIEKHLHDDCPAIVECNKVEFGHDNSLLASILRPIINKFDR